MSAGLVEKMKPDMLAGSIDKRQVIILVGGFAKIKSCPVIFKMIRGVFFGDGKADFIAW